MKTLDANQAAKIYRTYLEPRYFAHIYLPGETLYLSNRTFKYNNHNYEALLLDLPALAQSIEQLGGYQNPSATLNFRNIRYRSAASFLDWLYSNPITRCEMDLFVLYDDPGEIFGSDVSTKLSRLSIGEIQGATDSSINYSLSSIMHALDNKNIFTQINRTNWPDAAPDAIGKYENKIYGSIRDVPCPCVKTGATSNLFSDLSSTAATITLSEVDWPMAFPASGTIQIDEEIITYSGKDSVNKQLTGCTRGASATTAAAHMRGAPVWVVLSEYKYLAAGAIHKSVGNVKSAGIRIDPAQYSVNLNESGKAVITFTTKQILKIQGMHSHSNSSAVTKYGWGSELLYNPDASHWTVTGSDQHMRDQDLATSCRATNKDQHAQWIKFRVSFLPVYGNIDGVKAYIKHRGNRQAGMTCHLIAYYDGGSEDCGEIDNTNAIVTQSFPLVTKSVITWLEVYLLETSGYGDEEVYEMWLDYEFSGSASASADGVWGNPEEVIAPAITCDIEGYPDDGSGTYTGTPNALIEVPSDIRKHLLIAQYGRTSGEIGASFATARTAYVNRISGGYKFGMNLSRLGLKASEIFTALDEQSRSNMREDGGKFELVFNDAADPTSALTIDKTMYEGKPVFKQTRAEDIKNLIRASYDLDWSGGASGNNEYGDYRRQTQRSNSASITKYGELALDLEYPAIQVPAMAEDVADWQLLLQRDVTWQVELIAKRKARILEKGDWFTLNDVFASLTGLKWRVLSIQEVPYSQNYSIQAIQYVAP